MKQATIYSVAEKLGISASTVSRAFSRPELVKDSVRSEILKTAQELGYIPNRAARGLATGKSGLIGLVVSDITNPFIPPLVRSIQRAAEEEDTGILFLDTEGAPDAEVNLIQKIRTQVDGLIIASPRLNAETLRKVARMTPTVVVNREVEGVSHVVCDNTEALKQAAEVAYEMGHRFFGLAEGPVGAWASKQRALAVQDWMQGKPDVQLYELGTNNAEFADGQRLARKIAQSDVTAVFAFDDLVAAGVIAGLSDVQESVPEDRSVVGCDDVLLARTMTPALTTVSAPIDKLGEQSVSLLVETFSGAVPRGVRLQGELALRGTLAPR